MQDISDIAREALTAFELGHDDQVRGSYELATRCLKGRDRKEARNCFIGFLAEAIVQAEQFGRHPYARRLENILTMMFGYEVIRQACLKAGRQPHRRNTKTASMPNQG